MKLLIFTLVVFLTSCSFETGVTSMEYNDETIYEAKCNGTRKTYYDCLQQASDTCSEIHLKAIVISQDGSSNLVMLNGQLMPLMKRNILFKCE